MADNLLYVQRTGDLCVSPSADRKSEYDFKRKISDKYSVDHSKAAQIGPIPVVNGTDFVVPFQAVTTARYLFIETDGEVELLFSGGTESTTVKPPKVPAGQTALIGRLDADVEFTSLTLRNPNASGDPPCVTGYLYGD